MIWQLFFTYLFYLTYFKYITIYALDNGVIAVNNTAVKDSEVVDFIKLSYSNIKPEDIRIFIRSDKNVPYGTITNLLQILNDNGFANISLVGKYTAGIQEFNQLIYLLWEKK